MVTRENPLSLLLVDDDVELCGMMKEFFGGAGHTLDSVNNGRKGLASALHGSYDLVILDVMLPEIDGFAGQMTRLRGAYDALQQTGPVAGPSNALIDAMQTGDCLSYYPERIAAELPDAQLVLAIADAQATMAESLELSTVVELEHDVLPEMLAMQQAGLRFDRDLDNRLRELDAFEGN